MLRNKHLEAFIHTFLAVLYARKVKANIVQYSRSRSGINDPLVRLLGMKAVITHHGPDYDRDKWGEVCQMDTSYGSKKQECTMLIIS